MSKHTDPITVEVIANNRVQEVRLRDEHRPGFGYKVTLRPSMSFAITITNRSGSRAVITIAAQRNTSERHRTPDWFTHCQLKPSEQVVYDEWASEWPFFAGYRYGNVPPEFEITARPADIGDPQYGFSYRLKIDTVTQREIERFATNLSAARVIETK